MQGDRASLDQHEIEQESRNSVIHKAISSTAMRTQHSDETQTQGGPAGGECCIGDHQCHHNKQRRGSCVRHCVRPPTNSLDCLSCTAICSLSHRTLLSVALSMPECSLTGSNTANYVRRRITSNHVGTPPLGFHTLIVTLWNFSG